MNPFTPCHLQRDVIGDFPAIVVDEAASVLVFLSG
jgi:hypothetical protein